MQLVKNGSNRKTNGTGVFPRSDYYSSRGVFRDIYNVARKSACGLFDRGEGEGGGEGEEEHSFSKLNRPILAIGSTNPEFFSALVAPPTGCDSSKTGAHLLYSSSS